MRLGDGVWVILYLVLAFGGEFAVLRFTPLGSHNLVLDVLPYGVFFLGLGLAFWTARRAYRRAMREGKEMGVYCTKCGYNLKETPERCPECGGIGTGRVVVPETKGQATGQSILTLILITFVAVLAAAAIMIHVQIMNMPPSGH